MTSLKNTSWAQSMSELEDTKMNLGAGGLDDQTQAWINHLDKQPPPPKPKFDRLDQLEQCGCGSMVPIRKFRLEHSGVSTYLDNVCLDCPRKKELSECWSIICATCKRVVGRNEPLVDTTGFTFKSGKVYHVEQCRVCVPGLTKSPIIEKLLFDRNRGA